MASEKVTAMIEEIKALSVLAVSYTHLDVYKRQGHHFDDAVETFLMNLLFTGQIGCFKPLTYMSRADVTQIRPLLYLGEGSIASFVREMGLRIVPTTCPEDKESKRAEIKSLIARLSAEYPDLKSKVFGAMQRLPLDGWGTQN